MITRILRPAGICILLLVCAACRHDWGRAEEFAAAIRCGMSEGEVRSMAAERFGVPADRIWRQHLPNVITVKAHELDFVDIVFEQGRAVAVQRGNYVAFTTGMDFGEVRRLCGDAPQDGSRFRKPAAP